MYQYKANVTRVIDGDTFDATVDLGFHVSAFLRFRLIGINAPELRDAGGAEAKAWLISEILGKDVIIYTTKGDSFGRWLAEVEVPGVPGLLTERMLLAGQAIVYTKK